MNAHSPPERSLPRKPRSPASIQVMPQTPDGWCEVTIEVNGMILDTRLCHRSITCDEVAFTLAMLAEAFFGRC